MYQVMVVDDEPMAASLIVNIIKRKYSNFDIMGTAYDGEEALELMEKKGEPDVLITDIQMPVMNGYEATKCIRKLKDPALANISILAMTANAFDEDRKKALESGMDGFLSKPIVIKELVQALKNKFTDR